MFKRTPKRRSAGVFLRKGELLFQPDHETIHGVYVGASPVLKLAGYAANEDLGIALLETLKHARSGIPHPED